MASPIYARIGLRPLKYDRGPDGLWRVYAYDWKTGEMVVAPDQVERFFGHSPELDRLTEAQFDAEVARLRADLALERRQTRD